MEGDARELVSHVQKARKNANFNIEDRVYLFVENSDAQFLQMMNEFKNYIQEETLSEVLTESVDSDFYSETIKINKFMVKVFLKKKK
jgi:isoleucyl-tRNA synthetase